MASDRRAMLSEPVDLAQYLFTRIKQLGVNVVHGLPGDYNLAALDYVESADLLWVGNANELNAAYAADGYARLHGLGAIVTTFGVGELSALNGIAGAYAERVPVIHIVGAPSTESQRDGQLLHHTLGDANFHVFAQSAAPMARVTENLCSTATAAEQIDHALSQAIIQTRPAYLQLPCDMPGQKVEGSRLKQKLDLSEKPNDPEAETYATDAVLKILRQARHPIILVDACAVRFGVLKELHQLIDKSGLPAFVTPMAKGAVNETLPNYGGVYAGDASHGDVRKFVESSDLVLYIGALKSDFNTGGFTVRISTLNTIDFHSDHVAVKYSQFPGVRMAGVLRRLAASLDKPLLADLTSVKMPQPLQPAQGGAPHITHNWMWSRLSSWLRRDDIIVAESGTSGFGILDMRYPEGVRTLNQILWGSIGWSVGATQGAALAAQELGLRVIAFIGDGSLQPSMQEIGTMLRHNLTPIIFIINNNGYTVERVIHGPKAVYNNIQPYNHISIPETLGGHKNQYQTHQLRSRDEVDALLAQSDFNDGKRLQLVEVFMLQSDVPLAVTATMEGDK